MLGVEAALLFSPPQSDYCPTLFIPINLSDYPMIAFCPAAHVCRYRNRSNARMKSLAAILGRWDSPDRGNSSCGRAWDTGSPACGANSKVTHVVSGQLVLVRCVHKCS